MKRLLLLLTISVLALNSCQDEETIETKQHIQFTLGVAGTANSSGRAATDFPDNVSVQITVTDRNGQPVLTNEKITLMKMGTDYITEPVTLTTGQYTLTDFMIVNENAEVLYATPKKGSKLATIVQKTLPYNFSVSRSNVRNILIEVVEVGAHHPEDFGYAAFLVGIAYPLQISVFIQNGTTLELTSARASLSKVDDGFVSSVYDLRAKVNLISFRGDPDEEYLLQIHKDGYAVYSKKFTYRQLEDELKGEPLKVVLGGANFSEGPGIIITPGQGYFSMWVGFKGAGSVKLEWGDGEIEHYTFDVDPENETSTGFFYTEHTYPGITFPMKITGDIHLVTSFAFDNVAALDGEHAPALNEVSFLQSAVTMLDLEHNSEMRSIAFDASFADDVILPQQHAITTFALYAGDAWTKQSKLDYILENIHHNTVATNIHEGYVILGGAAISEQSVAKLEEMRSTYGWSIDY